MTASRNQPARPQSSPQSPPTTDTITVTAGPAGSAQMSPGEQWDRYGRYPYLLAKLAFFGILGALLVFGIRVLGGLAFPLFLSLLIAYLLDPAIDYLESKRINRTVSILIFLALGTAFLVTFLVFLYPTLATQVTLIIERLPKLLETLQTQALPWIEETFRYEVPATFSAAFDRYGQALQDAFPSIAQTVGGWATGVVSRTGAIVASILNLVMIPIFTFYFLRDFDHGRRALVRFLPPHRSEFLIDRLQRMDVAVGQWFRGQIEVSCILAVLYAVGLGLVFGLTGLSVQSGIVIGLLTGFLNVIPYFGFAIGSILAVLVSVIDWHGWGPLIGVGISFTVIQLLESYYITPRIVGDKVGLKPVTVIIVLLIGGQIAGLLGVLLAIPIAGAFKVILPDLINLYERSSTYTGQPVFPARLAVELPSGALARVSAPPESDGTPDRPAASSATSTDGTPDRPTPPAAAEERAEESAEAPGAPEVPEAPEGSEKRAAPEAPEVSEESEERGGPNGPPEDAPA